MLTSGFAGARDRSLASSTNKKEENLEKGEDSAFSANLAPLYSAKDSSQA